MTAEEETHALIDEHVSKRMKPKLEREYISLAHTFSLLKRDPREAFENCLWGEVILPSATSSC
jgi:hypothetical protein